MVFSKAVTLPLLLGLQSNGGDRRLLSVINNLKGNAGCSDRRS